MHRTKEAGKRARPVIVTLVYTIESKAPKTRIVIKVTIKIRKNRHRIKVLVNLGIEANYIKKRLALDISILLILRVTFLTSLEERRIHLYRDCVLGIITENMLGN